MQSSAAEFISAFWFSAAGAQALCCSPWGKGLVWCSSQLFGSVLSGSSESQTGSCRKSRTQSKIGASPAANNWFQGTPPAAAPLNQALGCQSPQRKSANLFAPRMRRIGARLIMNFIKRLPIILILLISPLKALPDGKDDLLQRLEKFKGEFTSQLYGMISCDVQFKPEYMMNIIEKLSMEYGITEELLPYIPELRAILRSNKDLVSLMLLSAMSLHYIAETNEVLVEDSNFNILVSHMMILQSSMHQICQEHTPMMDHVLPLVANQLKLE